MNRILQLVIVLCVFATPVLSQSALTLPESSQKSGVSQRIGLTDISIAYNSPLIKGREIWGEVVPFGEVWRAGANENTTISFSTAVKLEGKSLDAGTYGLHMIPGKNKWTIILSKNYKSWGSYFYDIKEDALRIEVTPEASNMQEWLSYRFTDLKASSARVVLSWEKISVGCIVEVNVPETVIANMRNELRGVAGFTWEGPWMAADYSLRNNINLAEAMVWIDQSINTKETFSNLNTKSKLLSLSGKNSESEIFSKKALELADEQQLNAYGYQLIANNKLPEALDIFKLNAKKNPASWNVYDSLAEAYELSGNKKDAIANYKAAMEKAPDTQKKRIGDAIKKVEKNISEKGERLN